MTQPRALLRKRRPGAGGLPDGVAEFFKGELAGDSCWEVILHPERLPAHWRAWLADHPGAKPPEGYEYLNERKASNARSKSR